MEQHTILVFLLPCYSTSDAAVVLLYDFSYNIKSIMGDFFWNETSDFLGNKKELYHFQNSYKIS